MTFQTFLKATDLLHRF